MCSDQEPQPPNPRRVVHSHHFQEQDHMEVPVLTGPASMISGATEEPAPAWFKSWVFQVTVRTVPMPRRWKFWLGSTSGYTCQMG